MKVEIRLDAPLTETDSRRNGNVLVFAYLASFFSAPVRYADVTQAALCHKLGASAAIANLPASVYVFGAIAPIFFACVVPHRWEKRIVVVFGSLIAVSLAVVGVMLILPLGNSAKVAAVVGQSFVMGFLNSTGQTFILQCLGRGTTGAGRARALKLTFTFTPLAAVAGSLFAQWVLHCNIPLLAFPRDFAALYLFAVPTTAFATWCYSRFDLPPLADENLPPLFQTLWGSIGRYLKSATLIRIWIAYLLWYSALSVITNLTLFSRHAMGREPAEFSGIMVAIQFGSKAVAGYALGILYMRRGVRAPLFVTVVLLGLGILWGWVIPGYAYLAAFALMGAGQLGGIYFPNFLLSWSPSTTAARDLAVLTLASVAASPSATLHGMLADHWGFHASFAVGIATAVLALLLLGRTTATNASGCS